MLSNLSPKPNKKPKILFYIKNLNGGGAERCVVELFKSFDKSKFEYKLLLGSVDGEYLSAINQDDLLEEKYTISNSFSYLGFLERFITIFSKLKLSIIRKVLTLVRRKHIQSWVENSKKLIYPSGKDSQVNSILNATFESIQFWRVRNSILNYQPDIIVSSLIETGGALVYLASQSIKHKPDQFLWLAVEQNNTFDRFLQYYEDPEIRNFWNQFTKIIYAEANQVITVSEGIKCGLSEIYNIPSEKIKVIHNPVNTTSMNGYSPLTLDKPFILAAGRLHPQKGFDFLIRAYAYIAHCINADLIILGKGNEQNNLETLAQELGVADKVHLLGFKPNLWSYMKSAECFVLSSRYEGFGNVIIEAMAANCPVVAFDCKYGPSELIDNMNNGVLVPSGDTLALAKAIEKVVNDKELSLGLVEAAAIKVQEFNQEKIADEYEELFQSMMSNYKC
jgi:GalNAc-alpha-(1->4)-GalNAc-alpha-(1->3)-diNAcBac-PP-undecaprenol alpha-1,4-N-acetyl-D-galactosaminyltransferase